MEKEIYDLTVIIPHYNMPDSLRRLLDSIGYDEKIQVIVVDDYSNTYLSELAACQAEYDYVDFAQTAEGKKGAGAARNTGLTHALGKWILFADSDDLFLGGWKDVIYRYIDSDYDLVYFKPYSLKEDGSASKRHEPYARLVDNYLSSAYGGEEKIRGRFTVPWSKMVRASLIRENSILFDEVFYSADVMFSAKAGCLAKKITANPASYYCIVDRDDSMSRTKSDEVYCQRLRIYCERERFIKAHMTKEQFRAYGGMCFLYSVAGALKKGYGWKTIRVMYILFREYRIPFAVFNYNKYFGRILSLTRKDGKG